jgi:quercetin dioxygenase-like cupin family protein
MSKPFVVLPENRSRALNVVGEKITVLASNEDTQGYELFLQDGKKGSGPPPHSHHWDESFFVVKGSIEFGFDHNAMLGGPGTLVHIPAGTEHWFRFASDDGQMFSMTGAGSSAAAFFTQVDAEVADGSDLAALAAVADRHGIHARPAGE